MVDKQKVEQAIRLLLEGIGEDTEREGLKDTPDRIALHIIQTGKKTNSRNQQMQKESLLQRSATVNRSLNREEA